MSDPTDTPAPHGLEDLPPKLRRRLIAKTALVCTALVALIVMLYYLVPWDSSEFGEIAVRLGISLVVVVVGTVISIQYVLRARYPMLRVFEVLAVVVALVLASFASAYAYLSHVDSDAFSEVLTRTDALYFSITTATTVGFGDISASTEGARIVVMLQMITNVVVLGVAARSLLYAARKRVAER